MKEEEKKINAVDLIKWADVSILLTGNRNTIRADRDNKKHAEQIQPLLDMMQEWVDTCGHPNWANAPKLDTDEFAVIDIRKKDKEAITNKWKEAELSAKSKTDDSYEVVDQIPLGRKPITDTGYRGLYEFEGYFYTNKIHENKLEIRKYASREGAEKYLESLKS